MTDLQLINVSINKEDIQADGRVLALVAHMDKRNHNGNIYQANSIGSQKVMISEWNHSAVIDSVPPVAYGSINEEGDSVFLEIQYDLSNERSANAFKIVQQGEDLEWSIGLNTRKSEYVIGFNEDDEFTATFSKASLSETSPVWAGADPETKTISVNMSKNLPEAAEVTTPDITVARQSYESFLVSQARILARASD